jgi:glycosyltransferase involved in cell wall biosynthesis
MKAARVFASPSTREDFGITSLEAMASSCTVIGADNPESAAGEVIDDAGFVTKPTTDALASALAGNRPPTDPIQRASQYDWDESRPGPNRSTEVRSTHGRTRQ